MGKRLLVLTAGVLARNGSVDDSLPSLKQGKYHEAPRNQHLRQQRADARAGCLPRKP